MAEQVQLEPMGEAPLLANEDESQPGAEERAPEHQYCVFRTGRERYCLEVLDVEEVVDWPQVTALPLAPSFLMGIFNLRGAIVPIIDISIVREGRSPDLPPRRVVVAKRIAEEGRDDLRLGIAADEVIGTYTTSEPLLIDEAPREVPHCCGMLRHGAQPAAGAAEQREERLALALDLKRVVEAFPVPAI